MRYTKIPETTFKNLQLNAGIVASKFDPETGELENGDIVGATSGGVEFSASPEFKDFGEDIDNCPKNMLELKKLDKWEITMNGSFVTVTASMIKTLVGAADSDGKSKVTPRNDVLKEDFTDLWWIGDYGDENSDENGGFVAVHMMNTLSTGGFTIKTDDKEKGVFDFEFTAHYSMDAQDKVPFEVFIKQDTTDAEGLSLSSYRTTYDNDDYDE